MIIVSATDQMLRMKRNLEDKAVHSNELTSKRSSEIQIAHLVYAVHSFF